jgi:hypothetical protein
MTRQLSVPVPSSQFSVLSVSCQPSVGPGERIGVVWEASRFAVFFPGRVGQSGSVDQPLAT